MADEIKPVAPEKKKNIFDKIEARLSGLANLLKNRLKGFDIKKIDLNKIDITKISKKHIWMIVGALIGVLILVRTAGEVKKVFFKGKAAAKETVEFVETMPVKAYKVRLMDFKDSLPVMGRIEGVKEIELRFDSKGILESFNFEEGERILEGDIIASLDQKDALLKLKYASLEMEKAQKLFDLGGIDKTALDQKKLEYESAKRELEKTNIYAPADGYLGSKEKATGTYITSQDKVGIFTDFSQVYATFDIIEEDSHKMKLGQNMQIYLDAYPGAEYTGTIDMISPLIEGRTRTQKIKAELENPDNKLKPGMFARGIINTYEKKNAMMIPSASFKKKENKYYVYVVHREEELAAAAEGAKGKEADKKKKASKKKKGAKEEAVEAPKAETGIVEEREVEIAYLTHDMAEVGKGLKEGELIIRELHQEFKDKDKVEITEVQETIF